MFRVWQGFTVSDCETEDWGTVALCNSESVAVRCAELFYDYRIENWDNPNDYKSFFVNVETLTV